jgi:hypothetical protein
MLNPKFLSFVIGAAAMAVLPLGIHDAHATLTCTATVCTSTIDTGNAALTSQGDAGPYATMTLTLTSSTTATVRFDSLINQGQLYMMGDGGSAAVNVNAGTWTISGITGTINDGEVGFTPGPYSDGGPGNLDGFGSFNQTVNSFDGFTNAADRITFTLTDTSGTWASASVVLAANASGFFDGIHAFPCAAPTGGASCNSANGTSTLTGFAVEGGPVITTTGAPVPEPSALGLLGTALGALGFIGWRRRKSA